MEFLDEIDQKEFEEFLALRKVRAMTDAERKDFLNQSLPTKSYEALIAKFKAGEWLINPLPPVSSTVHPLCHFSSRLTTSARAIFNNKCFSTVYETINDNNKRVSYLTCYLNKIVEYVDGEENKIIDAEMELADIFNIAVDKVIIGPAVLLSGRIRISKTEDGKNRDLIFVWPTNRTNLYPRELNAILGVDVFKNEGEM